MRLLTKHLYLLFIVLSPMVTSAQNLLNIIDRTEKAAFDSKGFNGSKTPITKASGFFLSSDGIAITQGSLFMGVDSAVITLRNGRSYNIDKIISVHPQTNLALIKVKPSRQKSFIYLIPSKSSFQNGEELLFFTHPDDEGEGMQLNLINDLVFFPYVKRTGLISSNCRQYSASAPVINKKGELCGILNVSKNELNKVVYNTYLMNDSNWVNVNKSVREIGKYTDLQEILRADLSQAILYLTCEKYIEAAKILSGYIKAYPKDELAFCLRSYARYHYKNLVGSREDMASCYKLNPNGFLQFFFKGLFELDQNHPYEAKINFELCLNRKPDCAYALTQLAILNYKQDGDVRKAFNTYSDAIDSDSLNSRAFYERARLRMQHSSDREATFDDINKSIYLDSDMPGIYSLKGTLEFANENFLAAIKDFDNAIEKDIKDVHAYFYRGLAHYNIGLHSKACDDWRKAGNLGKYEAFKYLTKYCKKVKRNVYKR